MLFLWGGRSFVSSAVPGGCFPRCDRLHCCGLPFFQCFALLDSGFRVGQPFGFGSEWLFVYIFRAVVGRGVNSDCRPLFEGCRDFVVDFPAVLGLVLRVVALSPHAVHA